MANLATTTITNQTYETLSSLTGVTFVADTVYAIQFLSPVYVREGDTGDGFFIETSMPFQYTARAENLYVKCALDSSIVNIAD